VIFVMRMRAVEPDRQSSGNWRVETILDDGAIEVTIFSGPNAENRALQYFKLLDAIDPAIERTSEHAAVINHCRVNFWTHVETGQIVAEWPRILTCGPNEEIATAALKSIVRLQSQIFETGELPVQNQSQPANERG
jgi:hypothetical protein